MLQNPIALILLSCIMAHVTHNALLSYFQRLNLRTPPQPDEAQPSEENDDDEDDRDDDHEQFHPSPVDIRVVQIMLSRSFKLPVDLVDAIFEDAEYWARSVSVIDYQAAPGAHMIIRGSSATEDKFLVSMVPYLSRPLDTRPNIFVPVAITSSGPDRCSSSRNDARGALQHPRGGTSRQAERLRRGLLQEITSLSNAEISETGAQSNLHYKKP